MAIISQEQQVMSDHQIPVNQIDASNEAASDRMLQVSFHLDRQMTQGPEGVPTIADVQDNLSFSFIPQ